MHVYKFIWLAICAVSSLVDQVSASRDHADTSKALVSFTMPTLQANTFSVEKLTQTDKGIDKKLSEFGRVEVDRGFSNDAGTALVSVAGYIASTLSDLSDAARELCSTMAQVQAGDGTIDEKQLKKFDNRVRAFLSQRALSPRSNVSPSSESIFSGRFFVSSTQPSPRSGMISSVQSKNKFSHMAPLRPLVIPAVAGIDSSATGFIAQSDGDVTGDTQGSQTKSEQRASGNFDATTEELHPLTVVLLKIADLERVVKNETVERERSFTTISDGIAHNHHMMLRLGVFQNSLNENTTAILSQIRREVQELKSVLASEENSPTFLLVQKLQTAVTNLEAMLSRTQATCDNVKQELTASKQEQAKIVQKIQDFEEMFAHEIASNREHSTHIVQQNVQIIQGQAQILANQQAILEGQQRAEERDALNRNYIVAANELGRVQSRLEDLEARLERYRVDGHIVLNTADAAELNTLLEGVSSSSQANAQVLDQLTQSLVEGGCFAQDDEAMLEPSQECPAAVEVFQRSLNNINKCNELRNSIAHALFGGPVKVGVGFNGFFLGVRTWNRKPSLSASVLIDGASLVVGVVCDIYGLSLIKKLGCRSDIMKSAGYLLDAWQAKNISNICATAYASMFTDTTSPKATTWWGRLKQYIRNEMGPLLVSGASFVITFLGPVALGTSASAVVTKVALKVAPACFASAQQVGRYIGEHGIRDSVHYVAQNSWHYLQIPLRRFSSAAPAA